MNEQQWLDSLKDEQITFLPRDGCPGPVEVPLSDEATLIIMDTQWFLHPWGKPGEEGPCDAKTPADAAVFLNDAFSRNAGKRIILAAHHPLITYGEHGGVFTFKDHLFPMTSLHPKLYIPLPVVGSLYPLYRKWLGNIQDTSHPTYKQMSTTIRTIMAEYPGSIYVAGHEHALQAIERDSTFFIVSGAGAKTTVVKKKKYSKFAASVTGFVKADIFAKGDVRFTYYQVDADFPDGKVVFQDSLPVLKSLEARDADTGPPDFTNKTVRIKGSAQYAAGKGKKRILGENYRPEWGQEIEVPVIDIGTEKGGLKISQKGGGMQTLSLRLEDSLGREYVLRSIEKFPEKAVPEMFRKTFIQGLVQDQISAAHPYAAVVIPTLADAAGIYHTNPKVVFIPDDPRLGVYRMTSPTRLPCLKSDPPAIGRTKPFLVTLKTLLTRVKFWKSSPRTMRTVLIKVSCFVQGCLTYGLPIGTDMMINGGGPASNQKMASFTGRFRGTAIRHFSLTRE